MNLALKYRPSIPNWKKVSYIAFDSVAVGVSVTVALLLRMNGHLPPAMLSGLINSMPLFIVVAVAILYSAGIYSRLWRLASLSDLVTLIEAATLAVAAPAIVLVALSRAHWMPTSVPFIQWLVLVVLLAAGRLWRRVLQEKLRRLRGRRTARQRTSDAVFSQQRALVIGRTEYVEGVLRQLELVDRPPFLPVGILDVDSRETNLRLRRVPILGNIDSIEHAVDTLTARNERPSCIILAEGPDVLSGPAKLRLVTIAQTLNLAVLRTPPATEFQKPLNLEVIDLADLLDRPQTKLDPTVVSRAIRGQRVLLTGAGGSIGRELARQIAAFEPAELILVDCGEFNLYSVEMELRDNYPQVPCRAVLCSIRQRQQIMALFAETRPAFVFHAAALKHVPLVEANICAGVHTNVIGTRNVADAARRFGVRAMVQVSTDKAVNPVGVMGATKRLGELYCQALDLEGSDSAFAPRFMTVRFGNVLGSSGSLIPLFQRQLERRAPLTVTHPDITRYFMTIHEAAQLVLHSSACALEGNLKRGRIIVLDMGEPVKIIDIARRMIRLAGLIPERDVPIEIVGLRPGEKLYEELFNDYEKRLPSQMAGVFEAEPTPLPLSTLHRGFSLLAEGVLANDEDAVRELLFEMVQACGRTIPALPCANGETVADQHVVAAPAFAEFRGLTHRWASDGLSQQGA